MRARMPEPIPVPGRKESKESYIRRFVASVAMVKKYPDDDQRLAAAESQWGNRKPREK